MNLSREEALQHISSQSGFTEGAARGLRTVLHDIYIRLQTVESDCATHDDLLSSLVYGQDDDPDFEGCHKLAYTELPHLTN